MKNWTADFYKYYAEEHIMVPERFLDASLENLRNPKLKNRDVNKGGLILGEVGGGKTYYLFALLRYHIMNRNTAVVINWAKYIEHRRNAQIGDPEVIKFFKSMCDCDTLLLDDVGAEDATGYSNRILYLLLDERYNRMKSTTGTSNLKLDKLSIILGDRIMRRLNHDGMPLQLFGGQ